jgi:DNA invertase Pin-like site-specific DNA recombinase
MAAIDTVLNKLDSADRILVDEFFIKNTAVEEIAKALHIDRSTVYRRANAIVSEVSYCFQHLFS